MTDGAKTLHVNISLDQLVIPVHAAPPVFLITLLLGKQPVEEEFSVLLGVGAEEGSGVDVEPLALAVVSHILTGLLSS